MGNLVKSSKNKGYHWFGFLQYSHVERNCRSNFKWPSMQRWQWPIHTAIPLKPLLNQYSPV